MKKPLLFDEQDAKRLVFVAIFTFFLFGLIVIQFYNLQIIQGDKWHKIASRQHHIYVTQYFMRGGFYSNTEIKEDLHAKKVPFVIEAQRFHLYIDPYSIDIKYKLPIAKKLFEFFQFSSEEKEKIFYEFFKKSRSRRVISWIDKDNKEKILTWWKTYARNEKIVRNALFFEVDYKRCYPFGDLLGQVLHTVQEQKDHLTFQAMPTGGLELFFDSYLKGKLGKKVITRSLRHPLDTGKLIEPSEDGCDIYLTINHYLQTIAQEELEKGVKSVSGKGGWAIVMDPYTGEILALAQTPAFDVRRYKDYFNDENLKEISKLKPVVDTFEPGSIMKPITLAICLKANEELIKQGRDPIFFPEEKIPTADGNFPGRSTPIKDGRSHNYLNMYIAIQKSSNIYFAKLVQKVINTLGDKWYLDNLVNIFGFSKPTGVEFPMEALGFLPSIDKTYSNGKPQYSQSTAYSLAIGYNLSVNSLQMLRAFAIIANEGMDVKPTLLKKIVKNIDGQPRVLVDNTKNDFENRKRLLNQHHCRQIKYAMKFTTKLGGTSRAGDVFGYTDAGKSGTAEKLVDGKYCKNLHISSFVGFVPVEKPKFVIMVVVDEPEKRHDPQRGSLQQGGVCAAPIFREIATRSLKYLGVAPDDPFGYPYFDKRSNSKKADWYKETKYLAELYKEWNSK